MLWGTNMRKKIGYAVILILIPLILILGGTVFKSKQYSFVTLFVTALSIVPFFLHFENKDRGTIKIVLIAVLTALNVIGRFVFAAVPSFKPVTALTVIAAMELGGESGFMIGSLTAVISNFYFMQGPWTPFQMFSWGILGFIAGIFSGILKRNKIILLLFGAIAGVLYSLIMDVYSVLWMDNAFNLPRFLTFVASSMPVTIIYVISNVIFLLLLADPIGKKLSRIKIKYGIN